jgi:uncharacterized protein
MVAKKALEVAESVMHLDPDFLFIEEAAMLHDIGIFLTSAPGLGCFGDKAYVCHGYLGREILEKEGLERHALVCERHVGVGISREDIDRQNLPVPKRDMLPVSLEEKIVCYADKFFSKKKEGLPGEKSLETVRREIREYGEDILRRFDEIAALFGGKGPDYSG